MNGQTYVCTLWFINFRLQCCWSTTTLIVIIRWSLRRCRWRSGVANDGRLVEKHLLLLLLLLVLPRLFFFIVFAIFVVYVLQVLAGVVVVIIIACCCCLLRLCVYKLTCSCFYYYYCCCAFTCCLFFFNFCFVVFYRSCSLLLHADCLLPAAAELILLGSFAGSAVAQAHQYQAKNIHNTNIHICMRNIFMLHHHLILVVHSVLFKNILFLPFLLVYLTV